jgi:pyruvate dehydrogenase E1 component alpha subunit/2-oxoisovalerate dehydrogenase E1 component
MRKRNLLEDADVAEMEKSVAQEVQHAVDFADAGTLEPVEELTRFVYSESSSVLTRRSP